MRFLKGSMVRINSMGMTLPTKNPDSGNAYVSIQCELLYISSLGMVLITINITCAAYLFPFIDIR